MQWQTKEQAKEKNKREEQMGVTRYSLIFFAL